VTGTSATLSGLATVGSLTSNGAATIAGQLQAEQDILVDTISEYGVSGVAIEGVIHKDNDVEVGASGEVRTDTISEKVSAAGVTIDGVLHKDNDVEVGTAGEVRTDTISEKTSANGVDIDSVNLKDGGITITGDLTGVDTGDIITVNASHAGATDTRTGPTLSDYDPNRPFSTVQAAINAATSGDTLFIYGNYTEDTTISGKSLTIRGMSGSHFLRGASITGDITVNDDGGAVIKYQDIAISLAFGDSGSIITQTGASNTVLCYGCDLTTISGGFVTNSSGHLLNIYRSIITTSSSVIGGTVSLFDHTRLSALSGTISGTGTLNVYNGCVAETATVTVSTYESGVGNGTLFATTMLSDTISESTAAAGVTADGVLCKDSGIEVTYLKTAIRTTETAATVTATSADYTIPCDATSNAITVDLPAAAGVSGLILVIKKVDVSANDVTINPNGAETIDGSGTAVISTQWEAVTIQSNGTNWIIL
jgi:hypothetical protein